ncbi:MAG: hypothetical protein KJ725_06200, partial [Gammaproteobacteria bacterium]|nr:hypothetical protein [Gammaproteobacteria bacterium]
FWQLEHRFWKIQKSVQLETRISVQLESEWVFRLLQNGCSGWARICNKIDEDLLARVTFSGGDMLEAIPSAHSEGDIYLFIAIFHGMNDAQAEKILTNLRTACGPHYPTIAIIDCVAEAQRIDPTVASFDMQMLIGTCGRERTEAEWRTLLERGGFALHEIVSLRTFTRLLVVNVC